MSEHACGGFVMMKKVALVLVVLVVGVLGYVASRPSTYHAERTAVINAPQDVVFGEMNSLENGFQRWSPWEKKDPAMKKTFSGPKEGVGASYHWDGNKDVGSGTMTIAESKSPSLVKTNLEFITPMADSCVITFTLEKAGDGTKVTWAMDGGHGFTTKAMNAFMNMDKMIGPDFEDGLKSLQMVASADAKKAADDAAAKAAAAASATPPPAPADGAAAPANPAAPATPAAPAKG
jgi:hypothetical protein